MNIWALDQRHDRMYIRNFIKTIKCDSDLYNLAGFILNPSVDESTISKLFTILDSESFMNLIKVFGGKTVKVPTIDELLEEFRFIKLIYCYDFQHLSFAESMKQSGFEDKDRRFLIDKRSKILEKLRGLCDNGHS